MRILFLASYFPRPSKPLVGTWALEQAKALARVADVQVVCCTSYLPGIFGILPRAKPWVDIPPSHQWDNVSVRYLKGLHYPLSILKRWAYAAPDRQMNIAWKSIQTPLRQICSDFAPDVVYAHHTAANGSFARRLHEITRLPYVITDHDFAEISDCEKLPRRRAFFNRILRSAAFNVCVSTRMQHDMERIFPFARAVTVHNGINPPTAEIFSTPRPPELADRQIIFSAGMFTPRKAFPLLIQAFAKVAAKHPNASLRIAGDGAQRPEIEQTIRQTGMQQRVQLLGLCSQRDVFQQMAWSDLFALLAWDEPFGVVFAEAMGAGLPIIAASDGGINDLVQNDVQALIVPPKNLDAAAAALDQLLGNPDKRRAMGLQAKRLVNEKLTWDHNAHAMLELFTAAIQKGALAPP